MSSTEVHWLKMSGWCPSSYIDIMLLRQLPRPSQLLAMPIHHTPGYFWSCKSLVGLLSNSKMRKLLQQLQSSRAQEPALCKLAHSRFENVDYCSSVGSRTDQHTEYAISQQPLT